MRRWLLVIAALLAGCRTVKEARLAQNEEKLNPGERVVTAAEVGLTGGRMVSLKELEAIALAYHPDVVTARQNVEAALLSLKDADCSDLPTVTGSVGHSTGTNNVRHDRQSTRTSGRWNNGTVNLNWTVIDFGRTDSAVARARAELRSAVSEQIGRAHV